MRLSISNKMNTDDFNNRLRKNIIRYRRMRGLAQKELAAKADVSHISAIEQGQSSASKEAMVRIADALGCDISGLLAKPQGPRDERLLLEYFRRLSAKGKRLCLQAIKAIAEYDR